MKTVLSICLTCALLTGPHVTRAANGNQPSGRRVAGRSLAEWDNLVASPQRTTRLRAAKTLGVFGASATSALTRALRHNDAAVRYWAASQLGDLGEQASTEDRAALTDEVRRLLNDTSLGVRMAAAYAVCRIDQSQHAVEVLVAALGSSERGTACAAADFLGRLGPLGEPALPALRRTIARHRERGGDYHVRGAAQNAIRGILDDEMLVNAKRPQGGGAPRSVAPGTGHDLQAVGSDSQRPNILWISCEDISPNLGCYGDDYAATPNLDRLAADGARFTRAFTPAGVCAVVRSGIITGRYPISIGSQHMRSRIVPPEDIRCFTEYLRSAGYFCTNKSKTDYQFDPPTTAWDRQGNQHNDWRDRAPGQPFFSVINLTVSHESQIRHGEATHAAILERLDPAQHHRPAAGRNSLPPIYVPTEETLKDWAWYHDNISEMDRQAGVILRSLEEDGLADNTIVVFWSDHGRGLPRGKRWIYDSGVHIPLIVRWPRTIQPGTIREDLVSTQDLPTTMLALAGVKPPTKLHGRIFLGPATQPEPAYLFFHRDRMDEAFELMRAARDRRYKYIRNYELQRTYAQHIDYMDQMPTLVDLRRLNAAGELRGAPARFFAETKPVEELYDVVADPHETENLAGQAQYRETLESMRAAVEGWQDDVGDLGLVPEPILMEEMRPGHVMQTTRDVRITTAGRGASTTVVLDCPTPGASIEYRLGPRRAWKLYSAPFTAPTGAQLEARAVRIGFRPSPITRMP